MRRKNEATVSTKGAWGHSWRPGTKQCSFRLPETLWNELKVLALKEGKTFQAKLLEYVKAGIEADRS